MQGQITPESQQIQGLLSVSALHLYPEGSSGRSRKGFLRALPRADFADWICFNYACAWIKYHPFPKYTLCQVDVGSEHSQLQCDLCWIAKGNIPCSSKAFYFSQVLRWVDFKHSHETWHAHFILLKHILRASPHKSPGTLPDHIPLNPSTLPLSATFEGQVEATGFTHTDT